MAKMSSTVHGLGMERSQGLPEYSNVQACWCRLWVSTRPVEAHQPQRDLLQTTCPRYRAITDEQKAA